MIVPACRRGIEKTFVVAVAAGVALFTWLFRFNDPGGGYAGLTDDHFFYLVRGWQILFGDLPVRDFADQGAPLYYYVAAGVQIVLGRGTLSELVFSVTVLAVCAAVVFGLGRTASGSVVAGLLGAAFHTSLSPRFYNYPKILIYVVAIPLLWGFADRPSPQRRFWLACLTVVGFLFRHDHGVFVALATVALLVLLTEVPWRERVRHGLLYAGTCMVLVSPYLVFIQAQGGVLPYVEQVRAWAERDRDRTPVVWPGLFDNPEGVSEAAESGSIVGRSLAIVQDNIVAWTYYVELVLPFAVLGLLAVSRDGFRPAWPRAREKLATVAILALVLDAWFLRSPLDARLADPSVPHAILVAWFFVALPRLLAPASPLKASVQPLKWPIRLVGVVAMALLVVVLWSGLSFNFYRRMENARFTEGPFAALVRPIAVARQVREGWDLSAWVGRPLPADLIGLSMYVNACTAPSDRVFVQGYMPQVLGLARRAFAGGHADLRSGFFATDAAQRLTVERLRAQSVPLVLLGAGESYQDFRRSFPIVIDYFDRFYTLAGERQFDDGRIGVSLLVREDRTPSGVYQPYGWPCFGSGRVQL